MAINEKKQWISTTVEGRYIIDTQKRGKACTEAVKVSSKLNDLRWAKQFVPYVDVLLTDTKNGVNPKLLIVTAPIRCAEADTSHVLRQHRYRVVQDICSLLYNRSVEAFGHTAVEYKHVFSSKACLRSRNEYGLPKEVPFKVRIVNALSNTAVSRKCFATPGICKEADLTVVFCRCAPRKCYVTEKKAVQISIRSKRGMTKVVLEHNFGMYQEYRKNAKLQLLPPSASYRFQQSLAPCIKREQQ